MHTHLTRFFLLPFRGHVLVVLCVCVTSSPRRMNDVFRSMEQEMLAPWGLASRFPTMYPALTGGGGMFGETRYLNLDFHETKDGFELVVDLPGMTQDDISVDVDTESGVLTVSGERKEEREEKTEGEDGEKK